MAAQGGIRDKVLRVSMLFEKGGNSLRKTRSVLHPKGSDPERAVDPWLVGLKVRSWAEQLQEGRVRSCAEIAGREGITRASVSQLWPLRKITKTQADNARRACKGERIRLRGLIRIARNRDANRLNLGGENTTSGYHNSPDALVILEVHNKTTQKTPQAVLDNCKRRLKIYESIL